MLKTLDWSPQWRQGGAQKSFGCKKDWENTVWRPPHQEMRIQILLASTVTHGPRHFLLCLPHSCPSLLSVSTALATQVGHKMTKLSWMQRRYFDCFFTTSLKKGLHFSCQVYAFFFCQQSGAALKLGASTAADTFNVCICPASQPARENTLILHFEVRYNDGVQVERDREFTL